MTLIIFFLRNIYFVQKINDIIRLIQIAGENIMLADKEMFFKVRNILRERGILEKFEEENGEITGHMMITMTEIPPELGIDKVSDNMRAFFCFL